MVRRVEVRLGYSAKRKGWDLRRFLWRHTKANGIDADTLAPQPLFDPTGLRPLVLAGAEQRQRIKDPVRQLLPKNPLTGDLGVADLAAPDRWADANALVKARALEDNLGALDVALTDDHRARLDAVSVVDLGFPHDMLRRPMTRGVLFGGATIAPRA